MDADLDTLCTAVYVTADDLLPARVGNARRRVTDAELVTLALAQAVMGIPSDRRFLAVARRRLGHLFPGFPASPATTSAAGASPRRSTGCPASSPPPAPATATTWCCSTPPRSSAGARSRPCAARPWPTGPHGWSRSHSRFFWGMRLHLVCALDGTPRAAELCRADRPEREVALQLLARPRGGEIVVADKGYAGRDFRVAVAERGRALVRPRRADEPGHGPFLGLIRQRVESVFQTLKDLLTLERHGARTPEGLRARIGARLLALAACVWLKHQLGRPSRARVNYVA